MINVWGDGYDGYPDLIITRYTHVLKYHTLPCKYVQLLLSIENNILKKNGMCI
jgi:hypothetical protein